MRSDQRYLVREAIRREQGEPAPEPVREPVRREVREYERYQDDEPPRREAREYERREYRDPPPQYREPGPVYSVREPGPVYADREPEPHYSVRQERPAYSVREPEPYSRHGSRPRYSAPEVGSTYSARETAVRRPRHDRPQRHEDWHADEQDEDNSADESIAPAWFAVTRATALFLGCVTLLNLLAEMRFTHFSAAAWWIDLHFLPKSASRGLLGLSAVLWIAFAFFPRANGFVRRFGALCTLGLLGAAGWTVYRYYRHDHASSHDLPIPFALHVVALLVVALPGQVTGWWERTNFFKDFFFGTVTLATCAATFPLALFVCVGQLDDRGAADVAAVFAGRSDADKSADEKSAANPFRTALQLYHEGQIKKILFIARSSEPGTPDETTQILRRAALAEGIAEADLLTPPAPAAPSGDSRAALAESAKFLAEQKLSQVLLVARFFEVPRIRLTYQRAGLDAHSMPIREDVRPAAMRPIILREATALWMCCLQPVTM
ncbi:MAG TPA: hypothetical protein VGP76_24600 [Planctomycetaceae bacterium]|nr:hypothetical protein [Planctomycetaceae bacterium]